eukprot:gene12628-12758_t
MSDPRQAGDAQALSYIGTQGPLPSTVSDFWRMVAVTNTSAIVMLTSLTDGCPTLGNSRPRCAPYFPDKEQDVLRLPDNIIITCVHKNNLDDNVFFRHAGVGRTGTFIAIEILLHRLHNLTLQLHGSVTDDDIRAAMDIPGFVASLRKQRRGTVQTGEQYAFIWQAVMDELETVRTNALEFAIETGSQD